MRPFPIDDTADIQSPDRPVSGSYTHRKKAVAASAMLTATARGYQPHWVKISRSHTCCAARWGMRCAVRETREESFPVGADHHVNGLIHGVLVLHVINGKVLRSERRVNHVNHVAHVRIVVR